MQTEKAVTGSEEARFLKDAVILKEARPVRIIRTRQPIPVRVDDPSCRVQSLAESSNASCRTQSTER